MLSRCCVCARPLVAFQRHVRAARMSKRRMRTIVSGCCPSLTVNSDPVAGLVSTDSQPGSADLSQTEALTPTASSPWRSASQ